MHFVKITETGPRKHFFCEPYHITESEKIRKKRISFNLYLIKTGEQCEVKPQEKQTHARKVNKHIEALREGMPSLRVVGWRFFLS